MPYRVAIVQTRIAGGATGNRTTLAGVDQSEQGTALVDDRRERLIDVRANRVRSLAMASHGQPILSSSQQRADGDRGEGEST